ncbi:hypothetical protein P152DRAFT_462361 [Eremomyces bilateralis CBS 781.70]|uniref:tRNA (guanine(37)-N1)-methyltransferase n=1 Tax=Eremomyces bilateralis CBS 781.70 TaxID=1392243 RepID=A0A6G1FSC4_9PEZI|nr:uncharacterized protein P152DRAFT_462361 [Eremomyces bilateralis CBS 781.70]KAF1808636.1 hypothetical protein P152DRAFT_462361 [Eremomyces bilateralis CBS 781.70]
MMNPPELQTEEMLRPPVNRSMRVLDRSFFNRRIPLSAARIFNSQNISAVRNTLTKSGDGLFLPRITTIRKDPDPSLAASGRKCYLLRPSLKHNDQGSWGPTVSEMVSQQNIGVIPYELEIGYNDWTYQEIMEAILPEEAAEGELPTGFTNVGHVAHLNLREQYLPHKHLIAQVLMDKNTSVRTVINKVDNVGEESEYRTFQYEVLAGPDDLMVEVSEENCLFRFDYAKVYWNSRLNTEHHRMVNNFKPGEAVCDVMAGVGPFAVPAGKKGIFVWANDLNPDSYKWLDDAITRNKVANYVRPFNEDGGKFIKRAAVELLSTDHGVKKVVKGPSKRKTLNADGPKGADVGEQSVVIKQPKFFSHFVMNLPASAITFLPSFIGIYAGPEFAGQEIPMPMVHVYTFGLKGDDNTPEFERICRDASELIGAPVTLDDPETEVFDVRDVAPKKRMFCCSFRLPREAAFRKP